MALFNRKKPAQDPAAGIEEGEPKITAPASATTAANPSEKHVLPTYNHNGHLVTKGIHPDGESGRSGR